MKRILPVFIVFAVQFTACQSGNKSTESIDYASVPVVGTELILEIGESESFIPGQLRDLFVSSDGTIVVSDWGSVTIEQFSADGEHVNTVSSEGGGPGEVSRFFSMSGIGFDSLMVSHQGGKKDFFGQNEYGLYSHARTFANESPQERPVSIFGSRSEGEYYATVVLVVRNVQAAFQNPEDYRMSEVVIVNSQDKILADSLYLLKSPNIHLTEVAGGGFTFNTIPYRYRDRFITMDDGRYLLARPENNVFYIYSREHQLEKEIPFQVMPRALTQADKEHHLKDINREIRREIEARMHQEKPPYLNIWVSQNRIWLHTDTMPEGKEMVVVDFDGIPLARLLLAEFDDIRHISGNRIYTIHKDPDVGDTVRVYEAAL